VFVYERVVYLFLTVSCLIYRASEFYPNLEEFSGFGISLPYTFTKVTYDDSLKSPNAIIDLEDGSFKAPFEGVYFFTFQGFKVCII